MRCDTIWAVVPAIAVELASWVDAKARCTARFARMMTVSVAADAVCTSTVGTAEIGAAALAINAPSVLNLFTNQLWDGVKQLGSVPGHMVGWVKGKLSDMGLSTMQQRESNS